MNDIEKENKEKLIRKIMLFLQDCGQDIKQSDKNEIKNRVIEMDVILDIMHFLSDFDENVKVLDAYWFKKRTQEKFIASLGEKTGTDINKMFKGERDD